MSTATLIAFTLHPLGSILIKERFHRYILKAELHYWCNVNFAKGWNQIGTRRPFMVRLKGLNHIKHKKLKVAQVGVGDKMACL